MSLLNLLLGFAASGLGWGVRGVDFWIFNLLQLKIDWQNNSKTKVEKVFFFMFMSSHAEMSFSREKITK
jgi:hypothetical protein